jgi:DNA-binding NarL/FixJ family response regulator
MLDSFLARDAVAVAGNGNSALDAIRDGHPDLVILDTQLFEEASAAFLHAIQDASNRARCIVVADRIGQFGPLLDAGADKVLLKGFSAAELRAAVDELLEKSGV